MFKILCLVMVSTCLLFNATQIVAEEPQTTDKKSLSQEPTTDNSTQTSDKDTAQTTESGEDKKLSNHINNSIKAPIGMGEQTQQDLKHYLKSNEITPMLAGPNEFITLITESEIANVRGTAILLPNWHTSATSSQAINYLKQALPQQGWTTIVVNPLMKPQGYPSQLDKPTAQDEQNKQRLVTYQKELSAIVSKVMEKALESPGLIIMISQGSNAAQLHALYQDSQLERPNALIILSAYMETANEDRLFSQQFAALDIATLDLVLNKDHPAAISSAKLRKIAANKEMKAMYRQRQVTTLSSGVYPKEKLLTEINGWLRVLGW